MNSSDDRDTVLFQKPLDYYIPFVCVHQELRELFYTSSYSLSQMLACVERDEEHPKRD